jgi:hypothetical protein
MKQSKKWVIKLIFKEKNQYIVSANNKKCDATINQEISTGIALDKSGTVLELRTKTFYRIHSTHSFFRKQ